MRTPGATRARDEEPVDESPRAPRSRRGAKGPTSAHRAGPAERVTTVLVTVVVLVVVAYPLFWIVASSLGLPGAFDVTAFARLFEDPDAWTALRNTLVLAGFSSLLAGAFGIPLAWLTVSSDMRGRKLLPAIAALAFMLPPYLAAVAYTIIGSPGAGLLNRAASALVGSDVVVLNIFSLFGTILVVGFSSFPIVYFMAVAAFNSVDGSMEQAARILGATRWTAFRTVTLPLVAPATTAGMTLAAVNSLALFGPQRFLGNPGGVRFLPTRLYAHMQQYPPEVLDAAMLAVTLAVLTVLGLALQRRLLRRRSYTTVAGKASASHIESLGSFEWMAQAFCVLVAFLSVILPIGVLLLASVSENWLEPLTISNLTLENFREVLFEQSVTRRGIRNSILLGIGAATGASLVGFVIAYLDVRSSGPAGRRLDYLAIIPLGLPGVVLGVGLLQGWVRIPLPVYGTAAILLIAYLARNLPYAVRTSNSALRQVDSSLEEAARITGASWGRSLRDITLPLLSGSLLVGWVLVLIPAMGELSATILLYTHGAETISIAIFRLQELSRLELVAAMALVFMGLVLVILLVARRLTGDRVVEMLGGSV